MKTILIIWDKKGHRSGDGCVSAVRDLGKLNGKKAYEEAVYKARDYGINKDNICRTPKVVAGVRFYIGVETR